MQVIVEIYDNILVLPVVEITTPPTSKLKQLTIIQIEHLEVGIHQVDTIKYICSHLVQEPILELFQQDSILTLVTVYQLATTPKQVLQKL